MTILWAFRNYYGPTWLKTNVHLNFSGRFFCNEFIPQVKISARNQIFRLRNGQLLARGLVRFLQFLRWCSFRQSHQVCRFCCLRLVGWSSRNDFLQHGGRLIWLDRGRRCLRDECWLILQPGWRLVWLNGCQRVLRAECRRFQWDDSCRILSHGFRRWLNYGRKSFLGRGFFRRRLYRMLLCDAQEGDSVDETFDLWKIKSRKKI